MFATEVPPPPLPAPAAASDMSAARRRRHRRRAGGGAERAGAEGAGAGKPRSVDEELQQVGWMLREFKTAPCSLESPSSHDHRCCPFYHSSRDRRRPVSADGLATYQGEPCPSQFDDGRTCAKGDACTQCHSTAELLYHPDFFRKRLCHQARRCPRGRFCAFAHARFELLAPHFSEEEEAGPSEEFIASRFKTQWCPVGGPHDWESCVYAHTYRDWRRVPLLGYSSHPCPRWANSVASGSPGLGYSERCPYSMACPLAHGAKEQLYHPQFYKTSPCSDPDCRRGPLCAFTHGEHDQRQLPMDDIVPRTARKPIPHAEELLRQHQPNFSEPPMYHALEDAPRSGGGASGGSKPRRRKGGGGGGGEAMPPPAAPPAPAPATAPPAHMSGDASRVELAGHRPALTLPVGALQDQRSAAMFGHYPQCQFMGYQWVMTPASPPQQPPPAAFFGACYAAPAPPVAPGPPMAPGAAQCLLTVPSQQQQQQPQPQAPPQPPQPPMQPPMALPLPTPSPEDSPVRVNHRRGSEDMVDAADRSPMAMCCNPRSPMDLKVPTMSRMGSPCNLSIEIPDFCMGGGPEFVDFASWQRNLAESLEASANAPSKSGRGVSDWKRRYGATEGGLRTPSSLGSPDLSLAPTRASSPRSAEGASSTHTGDCSEQSALDECHAPKAAWDECNAPREEAVLLER